MSTFIDTGAEARISLAAGHSLVFYVFRDGEATLRVESGLPGAPYVFGKYATKGQQTVGPFATACVLRLYAANQDIEYDAGASPSVSGEGGPGGGANPAEPDVKTSTAGVGTTWAIDKPTETFSIAGATTYAFAAGTPTPDTTLLKQITVTGGASVVVTFPSAYSEAQKANITACTLQPGLTTLQLVYTAAGWRIYGDPPTNAYSMATLPSASVAGVGAPISFVEGQYLGFLQSDGSRWCGEFVTQQSRPSIKLPTSTVGTGASGHLTAGTALPATYSRGAWCYFEATASTPAITAGLYWVVFSSTAVGTIYTNGPGSAAFNFSAGATMTASINTDVNLYVPERSTPNAQGAVIPGGLLGPQGGITTRFNVSVTNTAGSKTIKTILGGLSGTTFHQQNLTTAGARGAADIQANGVDSEMVFHGVATDNMAWVEGQTGGANPTVVSINMAADQRLAFAARVATATDFVILNRLIQQMRCQ